MRRNNERTINHRSALTLCGFVVLALVLAQTSHAIGRVAPVNHLTFSQPVALPGVVRHAGAYTFERLEIDRRLVRVSSRDRRVVYFTGMTKEVPRPRTMPVGQAVAFGEAPAGSAPPITAWYPIGSRGGHQFVGW